MEGVQLTRASVDRPFVNNDLRGKPHAKHCKHVWIGLGYFFAEGVELTKASVDFPSTMIRGQTTRPSTANMC